MEENRSVIEVREDLLLHYYEMLRNSEDDSEREKISHLIKTIEEAKIAEYKANADYDVQLKKLENEVDDKEKERELKKKESIDAWKKFGITTGVSTLTWLGGMMFLNHSQNKGYDFEINGRRCSQTFNDVMKKVWNFFRV